MLSITIKGSRITVDGFRVGLQLWTRLSRDLRLNIEPMYSSLNAHDNIYINAAGNTLYRTREMGSTPLKLGNSFSVRVGLTVPFNRIARYEDADMTSFASKNQCAFSPLWVVVGIFYSQNTGLKIAVQKLTYRLLEATN